jgi:hypothetical protein
MAEQRTTNVRSRRQRLEEEKAENERGILEIFPEPDPEAADADAALERADEDESRRQ